MAFSPLPPISHRSYLQIRGRPTAGYTSNTPSLCVQAIRTTGPASASAHSILSIRSITAACPRI